MTVQEEDGISPTAIREIMLLQEISHENIVRLDSVHLNRQVRIITYLPLAHILPRISPQPLK